MDTDNECKWKWQLKEHPYGEDIYEDDDESKPTIQQVDTDLHDNEDVSDEQSHSGCSLLPVGKWCRHHVEYHQRLIYNNISAFDNNVSNHLYDLLKPKVNTLESLILIGGNNYLLKPMFKAAQLLFPNQQVSICVLNQTFETTSRDTEELNAFPWESLMASGVQCMIVIRSLQLRFDIQTFHFNTHKQ